jgi:hypothetical protein
VGPESEQREVSPAAGQVWSAGQGALDTRPVGAARHPRGPSEPASARGAANGANVNPMPRVPLTPGVSRAPRVIVSVSTDQIATLDELAAARSVSRSDVVREAIEILIAATTAGEATTA